ncbi:MAG: 4-hydroxy-3-methylbut-2-enyl diphosphate reductase [Clostridia bacterium]|nr:4-hydroxy-3-methylbut-2-enyl diphosphate reductase [Clostridia bacterium]
MSEITVAKTSGFCFGVNRAVETVNNLLKEGKKVCTLGEIIHNPHVINDFEKRGVKVVNSPSETPAGYTLVIRSHGCLKEDMEFIRENGIDFVDATCPFVKKIHKIVEANKNNSQILLAAGSADHPEMIGIRSYFSNKSYVLSSKNDLQELIKNDVISNQDSITMISQTTFSKKEWKDCIKLVSEGFTNITIHDTICNTTNSRQEEAEKLSKTSDLMIVVGGQKSSNTRKLYEICKKNTETILVESVENLPDINYLKYTKIGIIAGASTPMSLVEQIKTFLEGIFDGSEKRKHK